MLGSALHPSLATKAADTSTFVGWCTWKLLQVPQERLDAAGRALVRIGQSFERMQAVMKRNGRVMAVAEIQSFVDAATVAFELRQTAGIPWTPKWHLMLHIAARVKVAGNPRFYATFLDEDYNGRLKKMAAGLNRHTWHVSLLAHFRLVFGQQTQKRSRTCDPKTQN